MHLLRSTNGNIIAKIGFRSFGNPEYRRMTPRILSYSGMQLFSERASWAPISYGNNKTQPPKDRRLFAKKRQFTWGYQKDAFQSV